MCILEVTDFQACGGRGFLVRNPGELRTAITSALSTRKPTIVNVLIEPSGNKKLVESAVLPVSN